MTNEEAIKMLKLHQAWASSESKRYAEAVDVAIEALEKQTLKKPTKLHTYRYCPRCDYRLTTRAILVNGENATVHCECCGQAIDWRD